MAEEQSMGPPDPSMMRPTVLLVEDDYLQSRMIERSLQDAVIVRKCTTQEEAVILLAQHPEISLILLDGCVPGSVLNTIPLLAQFRTTFTGPIVAMSSNTDYRAIMMLRGCTHECEKMDAGELVRTILHLAPRSTPRT